MSNKPTGWAVWEEIGISIPNPRPCIRVPRPDGISDEQWETFVAALEAADAEREATEETERQKAIQVAIEGDSQ